MTDEMVRQCLENYREYRARCSFIEHELHELKRLSEQLKLSAIGDAVSITQKFGSAPHGTGVSDSVSALAIKFADGYVPDYITEIDAKILEREREHAEKYPTVVFVDAWLMALNRRERFVVENKTIGGMFWRELIIEYKKEFGEEYSKQGLKKIRDKAIETILRIAQ